MQMQALTKRASCSDWPAHYGTLACVSDSDILYFGIDKTCARLYRHRFSLETMIFLAFLKVHTVISVSFTIFAIFSKAYALCFPTLSALSAILEGFVEEHICISAVQISWIFVSISKTFFGFDESDIIFIWVYILMFESFLNETLFWYVGYTL